MRINDEEFIALKDVMAIYSSSIDKWCFDELGKVTAKIGINVNEEKLKQWVKQAKFIEKFDVEDVRDASTRKLVCDLQTQNKELEKYKDRWYELKEFINHEYTEELKINKFHSLCGELGDILDKMEELEKE